MQDRVPEKGREDGIEDERNKIKHAELSIDQTHTQSVIANQRVEGSDRRVAVLDTLNGCLPGVMRKKVGTWWKMLHCRRIMGSTEERKMLHCQRIESVKIGMFIKQGKYV